MVTHAAYATCLRLARQHYENFPVASWLVPPSARPHVAAFYAFARIADDFADEGDRTAEERLTLLDGWQQRLDAAAGGKPGLTRHPDHDAVFVALAETLRYYAEHRASLHELLSDLLSAFRQDVTTTRYETWSDVLDYCRRSANPVGRLVLRVTGHGDPRCDARSDAVCTALQLTNFWQDLARDWRNGRLYVPLEIVRAHGARVEDLDLARWTPEWRAALRDVGGRTRQLFTGGRPVADDVRGRLRWELRATWLGGSRILDRLAVSDYDVFHIRPVLGWRDGLAILGGTVAWRSHA